MGGNRVFKLKAQSSQPIAYFTRAFNPLISASVRTFITAIWLDR